MTPIADSKNRTGTSTGTGAGTRAEPAADCDLCPRLAQFRATYAETEPSWFNGAVPSFGPENARLLIVGLAPGLKGANRSGRPFTGDYAGDLLYATLNEYGFTTGKYDARINDGLELVDCMITNAVRCVPPKNKPTGLEIKTCRQFLINRMGALPGLKVILVLGRIAHDSTISAFNLRRADHPFGHCAKHHISDELTLIDSYHCSRYNTNTGRLTTEMFHQVFDEIKSELARTK